MGYKHVFTDVSAFCPNMFYFVSYSVIDSDLAVWKEGISKEQFDKAKGKGTHYQIINHKLYREDDCMFPARYV